MCSHAQASVDSSWPPSLCGSERFEANHSEGDAMFKSHFLVNDAQTRPAGLVAVCTSCSMPLEPSACPELPLPVHTRLELELKREHFVVS